MEEIDKFSMGKFLSSPFKGMWWAKHFSLTVLPLLTYLVIGFLVWKFFFAKKPDQTNNVVAQKGSIVNIVNKTKKSFIPFIEGFTEKNNYSDGFDFGARFGIRFEF